VKTPVRPERKEVEQGNTEAKQKGVITFRKALIPLINFQTTEEYAFYLSYLEVQVSPYKPGLRLFNAFLGTRGHPRKLRDEGLSPPWTDGVSRKRVILC
jgi:hypothetical protein